MNMKSKGIVFTIVISLMFMFLGASFCYSENLRPSAKEIPIGSIIIGSHIIKLTVLNQEILDVASKSADATSQNKVYYKSEFSNGTWYDITSASSIDDISKVQKNAVTNKTIDDLNLTHWTKADGTTIEFDTGKTVGMQDINNVKDPSNMPELEELKRENEIQKGMLENEKDSEKKKAIENVIKSLSDIFASITSKELESFSDKMNKMDEFIKYLRDKKESDELINIALEEKEQLKLQYDMLCYQKILDRLTESIPQAKQFYDSNILKEYYSASDKINSKISELNTKIRAKTVLTLDEIYSEKAASMNKDIFAASYEKAHVKLKELYYVSNDKTSKIINKEAEIKILDEASKILINKINNKFKAGESTDYKTAEKNMESQAIIKKMLDEGIASDTKFLDEMDSIIDQYKLRKSAEEQIKLLESIIDKYQALGKLLPKDDFYSDAYNLLTDRISKLNNLVNELKASIDPNVQSEIAENKKLMEQMEDLNEAYVKAMEDGDISAAQNAKDQLNKLKARSDSITDDNNSKYSELISKQDELEEELEKADSQSEKDKIQSELDKTDEAVKKSETLLDDVSKSMLEKLAQIKSELKKAIAKGDTGEASDKLTELKKTLEAISDELMNKKDKLALIDSMKSLINNKCIDLTAEGLLSEAESMKKLASVLTAMSNEIGGSSMEKLETVKNELKKAIAKGDTGEVSDKLTELKNVLEAIADELMNKKDKLALIDSMKSLINKKYMDLKAEGLLSEAESMKQLASVLTAMSNEIGGASTEKLETVKNELKKAIDQGNSDKISDKLEEFKTALESVPDELMSDDKKLSLANDMKAYLDKKYADMLKTGSSKAAEAIKGFKDTMAAIADAIAKSKEKNEKSDNTAGNTSGQSTSSDPLIKLINQSGLMSNSTIAKLIEYKQKRNVKNTRLELITEHVILKLIKDGNVHVSDKSIISKLDALMKKNYQDIIARERAKYKNSEISALIGKSKKFAAMGGKRGSIEPYRVIFAEPNIKFKNAPIVFADKILVGLKETYEKLGAKVTFVDKYNRFVVQGKKLLLEFTVESDIGYFNDKRDKLPVKIMDYDGITYVSATYIADKYGLRYEYIEEYKCVIFYNKTLSDLIKSVEKEGK